MNAATPSSRPAPLLPDPVPQLVVDLSNVCRDRALGGARVAAWERFERVMRAWARATGAVPRGVAIADESLLALLTSADLAALEAAEQAGIVRRVPGSADPEILRLAELHGASVLSLDRFRGHRREHPWIQGCHDRFFGWEAGAGGEPAIFAQDMGHVSPASLSRHAEQDELRGRGFDARRAEHRDLLRHAYRCANERCGLARRHPERIPDPPIRRGERACCPTCRQPLEDLGPRPAVKLVLEHRDGERLLERTLEAGQEIALGRDQLPADARLARVSRGHVRLGVDERGLWACDAGSKNGTLLVRWDAERDAPAPPIRLGAGRTRLGRRDLLVLAGAVQLRRSGERFAVAGSGSGAAGTRGDGARTTAEELQEPR